MGPEATVPMLCNAVKWVWALGAPGRKAARYRLGTGQPTWRILQKAKFWPDPLRADTRITLREAMCAEGVASELDGVCTAAFARNWRTIPFHGDVVKHMSAKAHLLYVDVAQGSKTSLLPP